MKDRIGALTVVATPVDTDSPATVDLSGWRPVAKVAATGADGLTTRPLHPFGVDPRVFDTSR
jgi:hypothetical protein